MDNKSKAAVADGEEMSDEEKMKYWHGLFDKDWMGAGKLLYLAITRDAAAGYPKEDHPEARFFEPRQPPPANKPDRPPVTAPSRVMVLALRASGAPPLGGDRPSSRPSTTAARAAQGKKPRGMPIAPRGAAQGHTHARPLLVQKPQQPSSTSEPDQAPPQNFCNTVTVLSAPPQNWYHTVTVLSAPPHLAGGVKRPSTSTECAQLGKKHRAV